MMKIESLMNIMPGKGNFVSKGHSDHKPITVSNYNDVSRNQAIRIMIPINNQTNEIPSFQIQG